MRRICVVTGTRAEYGLLYWLLVALRDDPAVALQLVVTGSHLSAAHGMTVDVIGVDGFAIDARVDLGLGDDTALGMAQAMGRAVEGLAEAFAGLQPELVVLLGDRTEILAAAQAALALRIPVAHLHGGEVTEGAIDDAIRHAITKMAHLHFVAAPAYRNRVIQLGEDPAHVFCLGAPGLDQLAHLDWLDRAGLEAELGFTLGDPLLLVTYHPVTLAAESPALAVQALFEALDAFPQATVLITKPNADAGGVLISGLIDAWAATQPHRVHAVTSLGQRRYLSAMRLAAAVVGNSSSGLIEAPAVGTPTVNVGPRQAGRLRAASVIDTDESVAGIRAGLVRALGLTVTRMEVPGDVSAHIAAILRDHPLEGVVRKRFRDS